jgi:hypothetical protein
MRSATNSQITRGKRAVVATIVLALIVATLSIAPQARAWYSFDVWYGNRTSTSVVVSWTARAQEDAPSTASDVVLLCWTASPTDYPCSSQSLTLSQYVPVGHPNAYTLNGLNCSTYRVLVGQSYVAAATWDWDTKTITVPGC